MLAFKLRAVKWKMTIRWFNSSQTKEPRDRGSTQRDWYWNEHWDWRGTGEELEALCAEALKPRSKNTDARKQTARDAAGLNLFSKNRHGWTGWVDGWVTESRASSPGTETLVPQEGECGVILWALPAFVSEGGASWFPSSIAARQSLFPHNAVQAMRSSSAMNKSRAVIASLPELRHECFPPVRCDKRSGQRFLA